MKLFYFDVETTGLSAAKCAIHQLSAIIEINGKIEEEININIKPFEGALIQDSALAVSSVTKGQILAYELDYQSAFAKLQNLLNEYVDRYNKKDKFFLVGYNSASFDNHFLRALWLRNNDKYFGSMFWANPIDVYVLASHKIMKERHKLNDFKLLSACEWFGIEVDKNKAHNATYDVNLTRELFKAISNEK